MPRNQLFTKLPCSLCTRKDDWLLESRLIEDCFGEIILKRQKKVSSSLINPLSIGIPLLVLSVLLQQVYTLLGLLEVMSLTILLLIFWFLYKRAEVIEERVLAIRGLGLTVSTHFASGHITSRFIDANSIQSIIVNEGFKNCGVHFYLACVISDCNRLQLLFKESRPRLPVIARIYRDITTILH